MKYITSGRIAIILILIIGLLLSIFQFLYNRSLWIDEASLALNIINKSSFGLLQPLDYNQVAPILFLQIEKFFSTIIKNSEYGLRLLPLICYLLSVYLFYKILKNKVNSIFAIILGLSLFTFNRPIIYYSSELKQYMTDVFVIVCLYYFVVKNYKKEISKYYILGAAGIVSILLSNVTPIILFSIGLYLFYDIVSSKKKHVLYLTVISVVWGSTFAMFYHFFISGHPTKEIMIEYWSNEDAFLPGNIFSTDFYAFLYSKFHMIFFSLLNNNMIVGYLLIVLFVAGIVFLIKDRKIHFIILSLTPLIVHLILSALKIYPFEKRLILYLLPCFILICSVGIESIFKIYFNNLKKKTMLFCTLFIPFIILLTVLLSEYPIRKEEIKESLNFIGKNRNKDESIYVYNGAIKAFSYYNETNKIHFDTNVIYDGGHRDNKVEYLNEINKLSGRTWLLFSHVYYDEEEYIINNINSRGLKRLKEFKAQGTSTYLVDFVK